MEKLIHMNRQTIDDSLQEQGFCLLKTDACPDHLLELISPRSRGDFELLWIKEGRGTCSLGDETIVFGHSTLFVLLGRRFQLLHAVSPIQGYYMAFSPSFLYPQRPDVHFFEPASWFWQANRTVLEVGLTLGSVLEESVAVLEMSVQGAITAEMVSKQLQTLLFRIVRQVGNNTSPELSGYALVARFQTLVKRNLCLNKPASAYARELGVSPNHMNQVVKRITGMPASYHIVQHKIAEAKKQITLHHWDSKTMAGYLGFKRVADFYRFFKTNAGIGFSNFRKNTTVH